MIHRLALLMGGTGAAGVLALALALGGFSAALRGGSDAFVPVANNALAGGQRAPQAAADQPTMNTSLDGGAPQETPKKVIDTVYVLPPAVTHSGRPADDSNQPADHPRDDNGGNNNGGNQPGDDQAGDDQGDDSSADEDEGTEDEAEDDNEDDHDQAGEDDDSNDGDHSDDGGDDGGDEPGDD